MKKLISLFLCLGLVLGLLACGEAAPEQPSAEEPSGADASTPTQSPSPYGSALEVMTTVWDGIPEADRFSCYGGSQTQAPVFDGPGLILPEDTDSLSFLLLIPEQRHHQVLEAADLIHLTNACIFTGAALRVDGDAAEFARAVEAAVLAQPFVNYVPEVVTTITVGSYVVLAFGAREQVGQFADSALANLQGAVLVNTADVPQ